MKTEEAFKNPIPVSLVAVKLGDSHYTRPLDVLMFTRTVLKHADYTSFNVDFDCVPHEVSFLLESYNGTIQVTKEVKVSMYEVPPVGPMLSLDDALSVIQELTALSWEQVRVEYVEEGLSIWDEKH